MRRWTLSMMLGLAVLTAPAARLASASASSEPHLTATPNNVMVNATVTLVGKHFAPRMKIALRECGAKTWVVTQKVCSKGKIHVVTNKRGGFTTTFTASICPDSTWDGHPVTERRCYVGQPMPSGIDTITLVGATRLIVTYP